MGGFGIYGDRFVVGAPKDIPAHQDQVRADPRFEFRTIEIGEKISTGDASDDARNSKLEAQGFVDVLMEDMADATDSGGEDFRDFDAVADHCWGNS